MTCSSRDVWFLRTIRVCVRPDATIWWKYGLWLVTPMSSGSDEYMVFPSAEYTFILRRLKSRLAFSASAGRDGGRVCDVIVPLLPERSAVSRWRATFTACCSAFSFMNEMKAGERKKMV